MDTLAGLWPLLLLLPYLFIGSRFVAKLSGLVAMVDQSGPWRHFVVRRILALVFGGLAWTATVLAMTGSVGRVVRISERVVDADLILAIDVSHSMLAVESGLSRLDRARHLAQSLAAAAKGVRLSLVAFKGAATTLCPPTYDREAFLAALDWANPDIIGVPGTDLAAAMQEAAILPVSAGGTATQPRLVIIITDGNDTSVNARTLAARIKAAGTMIVFLGVGGGVPAAARYPDGSLVRDDSGQAVLLALDAARLDALARSAGGMYLPLEDPSTMSRVMDLVRQLSGSLGSYRTVRVRSDIISEFALAALVCLAIAGVLARPYRQGRGPVP
jgi:hypothetical protein